MLIDTHCHLDAAELWARRAAVLGQAREAGVAGFVVPSVDVASFSRVARLAADENDCHAAYGIHPLFVSEADDRALACLHERLAAGGAVAVGEIGLDRFVPARDDARQLKFLMAQLQLARDFDLPVLLHVRRAVDAVLAAVRHVGVRGGIAHAFNGSRQQADQFLSLGFKLGFGGAVTWPRARRLRGLVQELPLAALVLETDAPDMAPPWCARGQNSPRELPAIARCIAELLGMPQEELAAETGRNVQQALPGIVPAGGG